MPKTVDIISIGGPYWLVHHLLLW